MCLIKTKGLTKKFGKLTAVDGLNLEIRKGELTSYLGSNGAGKSTTISLLIDELHPTSGQIARQRNLKIGVVFQNSILDRELTVYQNLQIRSLLEKDRTKQNVLKIMSMVGIDQLANQKYGNLSGGMKRKVDIARSLLNHPDLLFLDEPTAGLDIIARKEIWRLLDYLKNQYQLAIFLTTHYLEETESADNVYIINHGKIVEHGSASLLKQKYSIIYLKFQLNQKGIRNNEILAQVKPTVDDCYEYQCSSPQDAIQFLNQYQNQIRYFEYHPVKMNDIFTKLVKED